MIEAVVNGYSTVGTKATFAVVIEDDFGNRHERVVPLETKSAYMAELAAIKYAMMAVSNKDVDFSLKTSLKHVPPVFAKEDGEWKKKRLRTNKKVIEELRELSDQFDSFRCELDSSSGKMDEVRSLSRSLPG